MDGVRTKLLLAESAADFVQQILQLAPHIQLMVIVLLWRWWDVRNKVNAGELMEPCQETVRTVYCMERDIQMTAPESPGSSVSWAQRWSPPPPNVLKLNCDGAFKSETKSGAWGFIIRDSEGIAVLAGAGNLGPLHDALMAETMAFKQALEAAEHWGMSRLMLETDSS